MKTACERQVRAPAQPNTLRLESRSDGQLWAERDGAARCVSVRRCFPWSEPDRFISLRVANDAEFALISDPDQLDRGSRGALEEALVAAGFVLEIVRIEEIEEEVEIRNWKVETRQGRRTFQTRLDDWPRSMPDRGVLIRDVAGDMYHIPDLAALDRKSRDLIWVFAD